MVHRLPYSSGTLMRFYMRFAYCAILTIVFSCFLTCRGQHGPSTDIDNQIVRLQGQLRAHPESPDLHAQLSAMLAAKGDWDGAEKQINAAVDLDSHNARFRIDAAQLCAVRGMMDRAVDILKSAVEMDRENPLSHFALGLMYERQSHPDKAMAEFRETKRLIDVLSAAEGSPDSPSRIIRGTHNETYYHDKFGKEYLLDPILAPLAKKLSS